jgi:hypothetical protein
MGIDDPDAKTGLGSPAHLIFHERDEGTDHQDEALREEGGELKANALPSPCGEDAQGVPTFQNGPDQGFLAGAEVGVAEVATKGGFQPRGVYGRWLVLARAHARGWRGALGSSMSHRAYWRAGLLGLETISVVRFPRFPA